MPTIATILTAADSGQSNEELESSTRANALEAMSREGVVDESTLRLEDVSRDATLDFGSVEVDLAEHGLVAVRYTAQAEPHNKKGTHV